jgi:4-hydroxybenzoate polyprenyltransferase
MTEVAAPPRWRVYLALGRVSNLPTVWTNSVAGAALALGAPPGVSVLPTVAAVSLFYVAGMFLNDAFDAELDRVARPERPIPRGLIAVERVRLLGFLLLTLGEAILVFQSLAAAAWGLALAALIVYYSWRHKRDPFSAVVMALCRACVYVIAAAAMGAAPGPAVLAGAALLTMYVIVLSQLAKHDLVPGASVAVLIAGISLLDAAMVFTATGHPLLALTATAGFPLTLALQRFTPGT